VFTIANHPDNSIRHANGVRWLGRQAPQPLGPLVPVAADEVILTGTYVRMCTKHINMLKTKTVKEPEDTII
jgi:hypothetical protein